MGVLGMFGGEIGTAWGSYFSARAPAVQAHHIGGDCRFVDKYEAGGIKPALLTDPASARASYVGALALLAGRKEPTAN
jgi:hypothetical protein